MEYRGFLSNSKTTKNLSMQRPELYSGEKGNTSDFYHI